eukprot:TRINITY_DN563_c0_g1_i1.p1 TRINITY_DN563_c0_g1~~TRINITY_DN563_c0_g1_i1.p1  ORF type:complete len:467 (-),score=82.00 TRINITY_DN563_c0_g1_i1:48-1448(-)
MKMPMSTKSKLTYVLLLILFTTILINIFFYSSLYPCADPPPFDPSFCPVASNAPVVECDECKHYNEGNVVDHINGLQDLKMGGHLPSHGGNFVLTAHRNHELEDVDNWKKVYPKTVLEATGIPKVEAIRTGWENKQFVIIESITLIPNNLKKSDRHSIKCAVHLNGDSKSFIESKQQHSRSKQGEAYRIDKYSGKLFLEVATYCYFDKNDWKKVADIDLKETVVHYATIHPKAGIAAFPIENVHFWKEYTPVFDKQENLAVIVPKLYSYPNEEHGIWLKHYFDVVKVDKIIIYVITSFIRMDKLKYMICELVGDRCEQYMKNILFVDVQVSPFRNTYTTAVESLFHDSIYRFQRSFKYILNVDFDEFAVGLVNTPSLKEMKIKRYFAYKDDTCDLQKLLDKKNKFKKCLQHQYKSIYDPLKQIRPYLHYDVANNNEIPESPNGIFIYHYRVAGLSKEEECSCKKYF